MVPVRLGFVYEILIATAARSFRRGIRVRHRIPDHIEPVELHAEQQEAQVRVDAVYAHWEELEGKAS